MIEMGIYAVQVCCVFEDGSFGSNGSCDRSLEKKKK